MSGPSLRNRLFTPRTVEAGLSPVGIGLFGGGTAVAILLGLPLLVTPLVGLAAWAVRVAVAARGPRPEPDSKVEPFTLSDPWRKYVIDVQVAKKRFDGVVNPMPDGPTKSRLRAMDDRLDDGIDESWKIAKRGHEISQALRALQTAQAERELAELAQRPPSAGSAELLQALQAQIEAGKRLETAVASMHDRLRLLDARFDELVARAVEVSVGSGDSELLGADVDGLVTELEALRAAIDETAAVSGHRTVQLPPATRPAPGV